MTARGAHTRATPSRASRSGASPSQSSSKFVAAQKSLCPRGRSRNSLHLPRTNGRLVCRRCGKQLCTACGAPPLGPLDWRGATGARLGARRAREPDQVVLVAVPRFRHTGDASSLEKMHTRPLTARHNPPCQPLPLAGPGPVSAFGGGFFDDAGSSDRVEYNKVNVW